MRFHQAVCILFCQLSAGFLSPVVAAEFADTSSETFGTFGGAEFVRHVGRFQGSTPLGEFDVPFEIVAPADPLRGNGTVLFEPPHFFFGLAMRDSIFGRELLFSDGFSYAAVGWGGNGLNVLDPAAAPIIIGGVDVPNPGVPNPFGVLDEGIIVQFVHALRNDPFAQRIVGEGVNAYATGVSQTTEALVNLLLGPDSQDLFELSVMTLALWEPNFTLPSVFERTNGTFVPPTDVGKVILVQSEGDLLISNAEEYRRAVSEWNYRVYEVSGTPHQPLAANFGLPFVPNTLNWAPIARAAFVAGHDWVRWNVPAPASVLLTETTGIDPVYGIDTGIARDSNGNALGGVRLPEVETGQAFYLASLLDFEILPGLPGLIGLQIDLSCVPLPDGSLRFPNHGQYVSAYAQQTSALAAAGYLLASDASSLMSEAGQSFIGKPGACD